MKRKLVINLPSLVKTKEFSPTGLQIQVLCAFLDGMREENNPSPRQILIALGRAAENWYGWQKKPDFLNWWNKALEEHFGGHGLTEVHSAIFRRATQNSAQDAKLFIERFDPKYKPTIGTEHTFPGIQPPEDIEAAVERSKARVVQAKQLAAGELPPEPTVPINQEDESSKDEQDK